MSFLNFRHGASNKASKSSLPILRSIPIERERTIASTPNFQPSMDDLKSVFDKFDTNRDGKISKNEYKAAVRGMGKGTDISKAEVGNGFSAMDSNRDGFISFKEFVGVYNADGGLKTGEIQSVFKTYDLDGDGKVTAEELVQVLKRLGQGCSLEACRNMIRAVDADGDGAVNLDEFMTMMTCSRTASK